MSKDESKKLVAEHLFVENAIDEAALVDLSYSNLK